MPSNPDTPHTSDLSRREARRTVREHFLRPHMLENYLDLFGGFETIYRLRD